MAENGSCTVREDGGHPAPAIAQPGVAHCVNTAMNTVKAASGEAARNTCWGKAGGCELRGRHNSVLIPGDAGNRGVRSRFVANLSHSERKATTPPISPPFIAGVGPGTASNRDCVYVPAPMATERTLILVKPDAFDRQLTGEVVARFERKGLRLVAMKLMRADERLANTHYEEHAEKPFFGDLVSFITRGPLVALVLEGESAIAAARQLIGATNPLEADAGSIRGEFATEVTFNLVHGSDSPESAEREIGLWFPEL